jgi:DNA-binding transcriptional MerR regulator
LHFCRCLKESGLPFHESQQLLNLYDQQLKKITKLISAMHEDLQNDYQRDYLELGGYE